MCFPKLAFVNAQDTITTYIIKHLPLSLSFGSVIIRYLPSPIPNIKIQKFPLFLQIAGTWRHAFFSFECLWPLKCKAPGLAFFDSKSLFLSACPLASDPLIALGMVGVWKYESHSVRLFRGNCAETSPAAFIEITSNQDQFGPAPTSFSITEVHFYASMSINFPPQRTV